MRLAGDLLWITLWLIVMLEGLWVLTPLLLLVIKEVAVVVAVIEVVARSAPCSSQDEVNLGWTLFRWLLLEPLLLLR